MRGVIAAYHKCCAGLIASNGGFVAKYMGDGVLAYFGYPQAHEHDAEKRGARGARDRRGRAEAGDGRRRAAACAGRHRDRDRGRRRSSGVRRGAGARRRRRNAEPRGAAAGRSPSPTASSSPRARESFSAISSSFEDLGARDLKGIAETGAGLGGAAGEFGRKPLRGAARGRPDRPRRAGRRMRIAAAALGESEEPAKVRWFSFPARPGSANRGSPPRCWNASPMSRTRACAISARRSTPTTPSFRSSARWNAPRDWRATTPRKRNSTSSTRCWRTPRPRLEDASLFAEMLSLPNDGRYPAIELTPQQRRQRTLEALVAQIEALTRFSPVLMIFEDAQWIDPTSLEALGRMVDRVRTLRALLIVTFRPEFDPPWIGQSHVDRPHPQSAGAARNRRHDRPRRRRQAAAGEHPAGHRRAQRRRPAVRGGDDQGGAGGGGRPRSGREPLRRFRRHRWRSPRPCMRR